MKGIQRTKIPHIGKNLARARNKLGLSQPDIHAEFGLSINSISRMENDHDPPTLYYIYMLFKYYRVNPVFLIKGKGRILLKKN